MGSRERVARVLAGEKAWTVVRGGSEEVLALLPDESVDSVVTDPPAGIGFMGKEWDSSRGGRVSWVAWLRGILEGCLRVLKPGGHALVWALPRTSHWTATAVEDAGFEVRDVVHHAFGTGFPKSLTEKALEKRNPGRAKLMSGKGTALKPAMEHWILARKPLGKSVVEVLEEHGTGALNIDACRIRTSAKLTRKLGKTTEGASGWKSVKRSEVAGQDGGRWPAHLAFSHTEWCEKSGQVHVRGDRRVGREGSRVGGFAEPLQPKGAREPNGVLHGDQIVEAWRCMPGCPVALLEAQSGVKTSGKLSKGWYKTPSTGVTYGTWSRRSAAVVGDTGTAARFFYVAKPTRKEREAGCEHLATKTGGEATGRKDGSDGLRSPRAGAGRGGGVRNDHPTLKGIKLMRWLCRLITPAGGVVLDPFCGSGTTGCAAALEGLRFVGVEQDRHFVEIARARIKHWRSS